MIRSLRDAVIATIAYADIFSYPLAASEITRWLVWRNATEAEVNRQLSVITGSSSHRHHWYGLPPVAKKAATRAARSVISKRKLALARQAAGVAGRIPTVLLAGVTGSVSMDNAATDNDIDLFIITAPGCLFTTRLLVTFLMTFYFRRRKPRKREVADMICLNMFMDSAHLRLPRSEQDMYGAHELLQLRPLYVKGDTYLRLLTQNVWAKGFLPNAWAGTVKLARLQTRSPLGSGLPSFIGRTAEYLVRPLSEWYMSGRRTTEVVTPGYVRFHPADMRRKVIAEFTRRLRKLNVPLDKVFRSWVK